ncbi:MAG: ChbG/HpnK family deacetylase [Gammaproteobacteria bacterium]
MTTRLILHADDFGETAEITAGICQAIEAGVVSSTSIMANMPGTEEALPRVRALSDRASFGVHLNFCEGQPLTRGASLVDEHGNFHSKRTLFLRAVRGTLDPAELEAEITAQIGRIRDAHVLISHVDGHKHLHQLPVVRNAVARVLPRFGIERVRVTRLTRLKGARPATLVREALAWQANRTFRGARLRSPARVVDLQTIMQPTQENGTGAGSNFDRWAPEGPIEVFCHPGTKLADIEKPGSCRRFDELNFLLSSSFQELLSANRARMVSYWDI